jgi:hypothetical protein
VPDVSELWAPRAGRSARVHRKLPTIEFWPCRQRKHYSKSLNTIYG